MSRRCRDSDALIQHGENLAHLMDAIIATGAVFGELLGDPSAELRARFAGGRPVQLFTPWSRMWRADRHGTGAEP